MASLEDYAQWLVDNQDKKGTEDFAVVTAAFKKLDREQQQAQREAAQEGTTALGRGFSRGIDVAGQGFGSALEGHGS